jgi:hypothetical protein
LADKHIRAKQQKFAEVQQKMALKKSAPGTIDFSLCPVYT